MKRLITTIILTCLLLTFTGCAKVNIETGIDSNYDAFLKYVIDVDFTSLDSAQVAQAIDAFDTVTEHYKNELGFDVSKSNTDLASGTCRYEMEKILPNDSYEAAWAALQEMLTDESITPFMQVDMTSKMAEYQHFYSFIGELDFATIYKTTNIDSFPEYMQESINQKFESGTGTATISLPGADPKTVPFNFNQKVTLELSTRLSAEGGEPINMPMENVLQNIQLGMYSWIIIGGASLLVIIIGIALHFRKSKDRSD